MRLGVHLPILDTSGHGWRVAELSSYARAANQLGYAALAANDHLVHRLPWLDGPTALASVLEPSGAMALATTVALPVIRGPVALARTAAALHSLSGGRLLLGVGPGSSPADYDAVGLAFADRWRLFDSAIGQLRELLPTEVPIWVGSWGSPAGLRRAARMGEGWIASAVHTTPELVAAGRAEHGLRCAVATAWTCVTSDDGEQSRALRWVSDLMGVPVDVVRDRVPVGPPQRCAEILAGYADAGVETLFLWPLGDPGRQLELVQRDVVPLLSSAL